MHHVGRICLWNGLLSYRPEDKLPVVEWLKTEGRFQHLFRDEHQDIRDRIRQDVDERWACLLRLCGEV